MTNRIAIVYSTWHGQAEKIARRIADLASLYGREATVFDVNALQTPFSLDPYELTIVVASVHFGRYPKPMIGFLQRVLSSSKKRSALVSVSGAAAAIQGAEEANGYIRNLIAETGWQPEATLSVAGAVPYSKYSPLLRLMMKFASRIAGRDSDSARDYEYTNWIDIEQFVRELFAGADLRKLHAQAS